jgi:hypothetical protein
MIYITVKQSPMYHQMTLEEFLFETESHPSPMNDNTTNTRTYEVQSLSPRFLSKLHLNHLIEKLTTFNQETANLREVQRHSLYHTFYIPKKSGGLRKIDAPNSELMDALRKLKMIFEEDLNALYHTSAFAYVRKRSTVDAVKRHQYNESKWFGKYDLSNFFGSTTPEFVEKMFSMIFPFSEVMKNLEGKEQLTTALSLAFLDGGLPQGTPISPIITNLMMIPIDFTLSKKLRQFEKQKFIYTRYADDFLVSSRYDFDFKKIENLIVNTLKSFDAPFNIKSSKTRYGSSSGSNWNLGVMLNKDNKLTIGYKKKRQFQAMLASYVMDKQNGVNWDLNDVQVLEGYRNYYRMIEGDTIDKIVEHIGKKFKVNIVRMIKDDLRS